MASRKPASAPIPQRPFGRHREYVSVIGLGGFHLGKVKTIAEATRIVHEAIAAGMTFMDNAWDTTMVRASGGWAVPSPTVAVRSS